MTEKPTQLRVVLSLHLRKQQHAAISKAAKLSGESLAEFIRTAADKRASTVLGLEYIPTEKRAA